MIDILSYMNSLKLTWLRRLQMDVDNKCYVLANIIITEKLFNCGKLYANIVYRNLHNSFWKDVVKCYVDFMHISPIYRMENWFMIY